MNIELAQIANEILTDSATKNANPVKLQQSMVNCLREYTAMGSIPSRKSMAMTIGSDATATLPDDFNGITRIGMCKNGCFHPISYNSDICSNPCSCETPSTSNTCQDCGGYGYVYFNGFGWWAGNVWNGMNPKFFAGVSTKSHLGEYKVILNGLTDKWLQFSNNLAGEVIVFEYESLLGVGQMAVPIIYKTLLMQKARWEYFQGEGKYQEAQYFENQYWNALQIVKNIRVKESITLDDLQRTTYSLFASVKI